MFEGYEVIANSSDVRTRFNKNESYDVIANSSDVRTKDYKIETLGNQMFIKQYPKNHQFSHNKQFSKAFSNHIVGRSEISYNNFSGSITNGRDYDGIVKESELLT